MATTAQVLALLTGAKVFDGAVWRVYDAGGSELADPGGVLWRGVHGALLWVAAQGAAAVPPPGIEPGFNAPINHDSAYKRTSLPRRNLRRKRQQDILFLGR